MDTPPTKTLATLMRNRRRVLERLVEVGRIQGELIDADRIGPLLELLSAKQQLIRVLREVEAGLAPFREQDPATRSWASAQERAQCAADADASAALLDEVLRTEREHEQRVSQRRDEVASQMLRFQSSHTALSAYASQGSALSSAPHLPPVALDLTTRG